MLPVIQIAGTTISMYDVFNYMAIAALLIFSILQFPAFLGISLQSTRLRSTGNLGRRAAGTAVGVAQMLIMGVAYILLASYLNHFFSDMFTDGNANYFGNLAAWLLSLTVPMVMFGISPLKTLDLFSPGLPLGLTFAKTACVFWGCCSSFEANTFYFNQHTNRYEFPVQMVDTAIALILFLYLLNYRKKNKRVGSVFPVYLILYSIVRFLTEFLRADLPNVLGILDAYQIICIVCEAIGLGLLFLVTRYGETIQAYYEKKLHLVK